jgi:hypothetical protein
MLTVRPGMSGNSTRLLELSQQGWAMVMVVPSAEAIRQRGSVHWPSPLRSMFHNASPLV